MDQTSPRHTSGAAGRPLRRTATRLALLALALTLPLAACSGPDDTPSAEYCRLLTTDPQVAQAISLSGDAITSDQIAALRRVTAAAPPAVKGDWKTFTDYLESMSTGDDAALDKNLDKAMKAADAVQKSVARCLPDTPTPTTSPT